MKTRKINIIAFEILAVWNNPYFGAVPYLQAMTSMESIDDMYGLDSGRGIVARFLGNAMYWRGADARRIKEELNLLLASKKQDPPNRDTEWFDPAGGRHYGDEDDPAAMYR